MSILEAIVLGLVQGITEFLPISSTGHLILARDVLGLEVAHGLAVDATLHFATAGAVVLYFRHDLLALGRSVVKWVTGGMIEQAQRVVFIALLLGTVPAVVAGLVWEDTIETAFRNPHLVAWVLIAGSGLFLCAEYVLTRYATARELTAGRGLIIGLFQALALIPGTSRSGATIAGGMLLGLSREVAARFAFLLSLPIIIGAGGMKLVELEGASLQSGEWFTIGVAAFTAFAAGIASIHYLLRYLKTHSLNVFVAYRIILALVVFALL